MPREDTDSPRASIALSSSPVCYRRVKNKRPVPPYTLMNLSVFEFEARSSYRKCPESHKNQERIFVSGDRVGIIMNFDPFTYEGEVWFIVTKNRSGTKRLWRRQWSELRQKLDTVPRIAVEVVPICEVGVVGKEAKVAHCHHVHSTECFCVKIGDGTKANLLWVEVGLFDTRFVGSMEDYAETVKKFPSYFLEGHQDEEMDGESVGVVSTPTMEDGRAAAAAVESEGESEGGENGNSQLQSLNTSDVEEEVEEEEEEEEEVKTIAEVNA